MPSLCRLRLRRVSRAYPSRLCVRSGSHAWCDRGEKVLDGSRQTVSRMRHAVRGWRTFIKYKGRRVSPLREALGIDSIVFPELEDLFSLFWKTKSVLTALNILFFGVSSLKLCCRTMRSAGRFRLDCVSGYRCEEQNFATDATETKGRRAFDEATVVFFDKLIT